MSPNNPSPTSDPVKVKPMVETAPDTALVERRPLIQIEALNVAEAIFLAADGCSYPITNWVDAEGDECEPEDAVTCVAGASDRWWSLTIANFKGARSQ